MIDQLAATLALRNRAISVSVATTGSTTLSATALGFARASGSFLSEGFYPGQEVYATGFSAANNAACVVTQVTTGFLTIEGGRAVQPATAGRTIVCGLPSHRAWENVEFTPVAGFPYISEQFVPATSKLRTGPAAGGIVEETGLYVLTLYGLQKYGASAIRKYIDALKLLYTPGTNFSVGSNTLRTRTDVSAQAGQIIPLGNGWSTCQLTIPWWSMSVNAVAA